MKKNILGAIALVIVCAVLAKVMPSAHSEGQKSVASDYEAVTDTIPVADIAVESSTQRAAQTADAPTAVPEELAIPKYESPRGGQIIVHRGYTLSYDADYKTP